MKTFVKGYQMKKPAEKTFYLLLFTFYFSLGVLASAQAEALPEAAKIVPPETVLLVEVDNFGQLKEQFERTSFYKLYKDPAMAAFVEDFKNKWREKMRELDNEIAIAIIDADVLPSGRVAVALVLNEQTIDAGKPPFLFIIQWGEKITKIKEAVDKMVKKAIEDGSHKKSEDYRGVSIKTIIDEGSSRLNYCFIDDCLIESVNLDVLKFVIAHIKGASSPTLADDADYTATTRAIGPYHDIDFYINIKQIIKTTLAEDTTGQAKTTTSNLGFDNVTSFGGSIGIGRLAGSCCSGKALLKINGGKKGVCKMLEPESAILRPPRFIPASACSATFFNLDIKKAYNELGNILKRFSPQAATVMYMPLLPPSPDGEPGLELKCDIIDYLGSQIIIAQSINKPFPANSTPTETYFALAVNDRKALEKSLSLLHSKVLAANKPDARRQLLGHTIYLLSLPALPFLCPGLTPMQDPTAPTATQMPTFAFTVTNTHLILGVESTVERAIRALSSTNAAPISSAKWFTLSQSAIPSTVGLASLQDNTASGELSWRMMKKRDKDKNKCKDSSISMGIGMSSNFGLIFSPTGLDLFNFSLLPEFDAVRKYFGLSSFYGISRPDGFFFEFKYLNPPGTN